MLVEIEGRMRTKRNGTRSKGIRKGKKNNARHCMLKMAGGRGRTRSYRKLEEGAKTGSKRCNPKKLRMIKH